MSRERTWSAAEVALAVAVAGIVLGPYATVGLDFRDALVVQAVVVLACVVAALSVGLSRRGGWRNVAALPRPVLAGGALWTAAAVLGTAVALARGNEPRLVAGQLFAIGLLPVGIVAAGAVCPGTRRAVFTSALSGSILVAIGLHLVYPFVVAATGASPLHSHRLYLPNAVSVAGVITIALMLAAAGVLELGGRRRGLAVLGVVVFAGYIVGSGTRSLWAASAVGIASIVLCEVAAGSRTRGVRRLALGTIAVPIIGVALMAAAWNAPTRGVLPQAFPEAPFWVLPPGADVSVDGVDGSLSMLIPSDVKVMDRLSRTLSHGYPVDTAALMLFSAEVSGARAGDRLVLRFETTEGEPCTYLGLTLPPADGWTRVARPVMRPPVNAPVVSVRLRTAGDRGAEPLRLRDVRLERFQPWLPERVHRELVFVTHRVLSTMNALRWGIASSLPSLRYRIAESRTLLTSFAGASWSRRLLGSGLGARFELHEVGFSATGVPMRIHNPNYIHNFYAYLLYKLGLLGSALAAGAIGCWLVTPRLEIRRTRATSAVHLPIAALAIWITYLVWAVLSPELIDFRVAPLIGMMVAVTSSNTAVRATVVSN